MDRLVRDLSQKALVQIHYYELGQVCAILEKQEAHSLH